MTVVVPEATKPKHALSDEQWDRLAKNLTDLMRLVPLLDTVTFTFMSSPQGGQKDDAVRTVPGPKAPFSIDPYQLAATAPVKKYNGKTLDPAELHQANLGIGSPIYGVLPTLQHWAEWLRVAANEATADRGMLGCTDQCLYSTTAYILRHREFIIDWKWGRPLHQSVGWLTALVRKATGDEEIDPPRCKQILKDTKQHCDATLVTFIPDGMEDEKDLWLRCPKCGREYTASSELRRLGDLQGAMTLAMLAVKLDLPERTIRRYANEEKDLGPEFVKGKLQKVRGTVLVSTGKSDPRGRKLYDLTESRERIARYAGTTSKHHGLAV